MREKACHQKEGRHPERVDDEEQERQSHAGMGVLDDPEPPRRRNERDGCVQDDAEKQGKAPYCVKRVQPFRSGA